MKKVGLVTGILLMILAGIGGIICLALPSLTNNRINFGEAILGFIPSVIVFILGLAIAVVSALLLFKSNKYTLKS